MSGSFFVTGTDTGVGKTVVSGGIARILADRGSSPGVMKPVETGHDRTGGWPADAAFLRDAARVSDLAERVVPAVYREPLAPLVAARREDRPVDLAELDRAYEELQRAHPLVIVEGAGGITVPITDDLTMAGLASRWHLPVLIVCRPNLGTLNHAVLTVAFARAEGLRVLGLIVSGYDPRSDDVAERTNPQMLEELCEAPLIAVAPRRAAIDSPDDAATSLLEGGFDPERFGELFTEPGTRTPALS